MFLSILFCSCCSCTSCRRRFRENIVKLHHVSQLNTNKCIYINRLSVDVDVSHCAHILFDLCYCIDFVLFPDFEQVKTQYPKNVKGSICNHFESTRLNHDSTVENIYRVDFKKTKGDFCLRCLFVLHSVFSKKNKEVSTKLIRK